MIILSCKWSFQLNLFLSWGRDAGRLRPRVQPLTLLYTIKDREGTPFIYLQWAIIINSTSFTYLDLCIPSNCCKCTNLIMKNHKTRTFSQLFHSHEIIMIMIIINNNSNNLEVAHLQSGSLSTWFLIELEFANVGFWGEGKTGVPGEKPLGARERTNNKLNPHMVSTLGFEPGKWQIFLPEKGTSFERSLP